MGTRDGYERLKKIVAGIRSDTPTSSSDGDVIALRVSRYGELVAEASLPAAAGHQAIDIGAVSNRSTQLTAGKRYHIVAEADCHIAVGGSTVAATTSSYWLPSYTVLTIEAASGEDYVAVIQDAVAVTGGLHISQAS